MGYHPPYCNPTTFIFALLWLDGDNNGEWRIHGLWPETCERCPNCGYPSYCRKVYFNRSTIDDLIPKIKHRWFPSRNLIEHEWLKHGSCTANVTEFEYFNKTLSLWDCISIKDECSNDNVECRLLLQTDQVQKC